MGFGRVIANAATRKLTYMAVGAAVHGVGNALKESKHENNKPAQASTEQPVVLHQKRYWSIWTWFAFILAIWMAGKVGHDNALQEIQYNAAIAQQTHQIVKGK